MNIPNLDAQTEEDLVTFRQTFLWLAEYANFKGHAMYFRGIGDIPAALGFEKKCEYIYNLLPKSAKW